MTAKNGYAVLAQGPEQGDHVQGVTYTPAPRASFHRSSTLIEALTEKWRVVKMRITEFVDVNLGMLLIMLSQLFFCLMNLAVKELNNLDTPVPALELIVIRMAITFTCCVLYMIIMKIPDPLLGPKGVRLLLVCRGLMGFFGLFGVYYALQYLSLADTTVLTFLGPLFTAVAGHFILGESYSKREALAALCSLFGVILIARPPFLFGNSSSINGDSDDSAARATPTERIRAVAVLLLGVLLGTGALISIRAIGKRAHAMHSMTFFSLWCVIVATSAMVFLKVPIVYPTHWQWAAMLLMIGIFGFIAQTFTTMGLQRETAARGSMGVYLQVIFAGILERIFFKTVPSLLSMVGAVIIMASAIYVVLTKKSQSKTTSNNMSLDSEDSTLEEGLLNNRDSDSQEEFFKLDDMGSVASSIVSTNESRNPAKEQA